MTPTTKMQEGGAYQPKRNDRVTWRGHPGTVIDDYWRDRDRYTVMLDGDGVPLDFGAEALRLIPSTVGGE